MDGLATLVMFVRLPVPGETKTRLAVDSSPEHAANLARVMAEHLVNALLPQQREAWRLVIYGAPGERIARIENWLLEHHNREAVCAEPQPEGSLADRLEHAQTLGNGPLVFIGSDCPDVSSTDVHTALRLVKDERAVVGPALDGGFWLLALPGKITGIFRDVPYSTPDTLAVLESRLAGHGFSVTHLDKRRDIDTAKDWRALEGSLRSPLAARARRLNIDLPE